MSDLEIICALIRSYVFGQEVEIPGNVDWPRVIQKARKENVSVVCYEGARKLPLEKQPQFSDMLQWDISSQGIRENYRHRHDVTTELCRFLKENGIRMLLLKGETLASYYPDCTDRESGDVDFVAIDNFERCNKLLMDRGIDIDLEKTGYHSAFSYKGIEFENHNPDCRFAFYFRKSDYRTFRLLKESYGNLQEMDGGCLQADDTTKFVYIVKHAGQHLRWSNISLKMLLDLTLMAKKDGSLFERSADKLDSVGLYGFARTLLCASETLFKLEFGYEWSRWEKSRARYITDLALSEKILPIKRIWIILRDKTISYIEYFTKKRPK